MTLLVKVLRNNINKGKQDSNDAGPLALAIRRTIRKATNVSVTDNRIEIDGQSYVLPIRASRFMRKFNKDKNLVGPQAFRLTPITAA